MKDKLKLVLFFLIETISFYIFSAVFLGVISFVLISLISPNSPVDEISFVSFTVGPIVMTFFNLMLGSYKSFEEFKEEKGFVDED